MSLVNVPKVRLVVVGGGRKNRGPLESGKDLDEYFIDICI